MPRLPRRRIRQVAARPAAAQCRACEAADLPRQSVVGLHRLPHAQGPGAEPEDASSPTTTFASTGSPSAAPAEGGVEPMKTGTTRRGGNEAALETSPRCRHAGIGRTRDAIGERGGRSPCWRSSICSRRRRLLRLPAVPASRDWPTRCGGRSRRGAMTRRGARLIAGWTSVRARERPGITGLAGPGRRAAARGGRGRRAGQETGVRRGSAGSPRRDLPGPRRPYHRGRADPPRGVRAEVGAPGRGRQGARPHLPGHLPPHAGRRGRRAMPGTGPAATPSPICGATRSPRAPARAPAILIRNYRAALERDPNLDKARLGLAEQLSKDRRFDEADQEYRTYLRRNPSGRRGAGGPRAQRLPGRRYRRGHQAVRGGPEGRPPPARRARRNWPRLDMRFGRFDQACRRLELLTQIDPFDHEIRYTYSQALRVVGQTEGRGPRASGRRSSARSTISSSSSGPRSSWTPTT